MKGRGSSWATLPESPVVGMNPTDAGSIGHDAVDELQIHPQIAEFLNVLTR
jgi:hypothetical protein